MKCPVVCFSPYASCMLQWCIGLFSKHDRNCLYLFSNILSASLDFSVEFSPCTCTSFPHFLGVARVWVFVESKRNFIRVRKMMCTQTHTCNSVISETISSNIFTFTSYHPFIHSFHWLVQNATIPYSSQELLPFLSEMYFFLPSVSWSINPIVPKFMYNTLLGILFSSILCTCRNQRNLFNLIVSVIVGF